MDTISQERRSENMRRIRSKDTKAEMVLRKALWSAGLRGYRVHPQRVTGRPDVAYVGKRLAVFVDGCFWHSCPRCFVAPKSNTTYWSTKLARNQGRDLEVTEALRKEGWTVLRVWEHEVEEQLDDVIQRIRAAL